MTDSKLTASAALPRDYWEEANEYLDGLHSILLNDGLPAARLDDTPCYFVSIGESDDAVSVSMDVDNKYITVEATLGPWQAKQVIEFLRHLPKEP